MISWSDEVFDVASNLFEVATHYQSDSVTWAVRTAKPFQKIKFRPNPFRWSSRATADLHQPPYRFSGQLLRSAIAHPVAGRI